MCINVPSSMAQIAQLGPTRFSVEKSDLPNVLGYGEDRALLGAAPTVCMVGRGHMSVPYTYLEPVCFLYIYTKPPKVPYSRRVSSLLTLRKACPREPRG